MTSDSGGHIINTDTDLSSRETMTSVSDSHIINTDTDLSSRETMTSVSDGHIINTDTDLSSRKWEKGSNPCLERNNVKYILPRVYSILAV